MFIHRRHITAQQTLLGPEPFFLDDNGTSRDLADEWRNPKVVIATVLMIVGGNVIRSALSQATGPHCTPICFSFGWVSYAVSALADIFGEGKLLPLPDHAVKVFNLSTGYSRLNRNWVIGRMVRDHPSIISEEEPLGDNGIRIAVYEAQSRDTNPPRNKMLYISCVFTVAVQLVVASVPAILSNGSEWGVIIVTLIGTALAFLTAILPQWTVEKLPNKQNSTQTYALTAGNGSRDVMIIKGNGHCYDLEELAAAESPENGRPWVKIPSLSKAREGSRRRVSREVWGKPLGFLITRGACMLMAILWMLLFITIPGIEDHTWYLIIVGSLGLFYNAVTAGLKRNPQERGIPLKLTDTISTWKVMDGLMDLEVSHEKCGKSLLSEFFPGEHREEETEWWNTRPDGRKNTVYDLRRMQDATRRQLPRSNLPRYQPYRSSNAQAHLSADSHRHPISSSTAPPALSQSTNELEHRSEIVEILSSSITKSRPQSPAATARQLKGAISNQSGQSQIHNLNLGESSGSRGVGSIDAIAKTVSSRSQNEAADAAEERVKLTKHPDWD